MSLMKTFKPLTLPSGFSCSVGSGKSIGGEGEAVHILTFPSQSGAGEISLAGLAWEEVDSPTNLLKTEIQSS